MRRLTPIDWANEAHKIAQSNVYRRVPKTGAVLGVAYYNRNFAVVDSQLTKAGLRLAKVLNDALK